MRSRIKILLFLCALVVSTVAVGLFAYAGDGKTFPGSICNPSDNNDYYYITGSEMRNTDPNYNTTFRCAMLRDNLSSGSRAWNKVTIYVWDRHQNEGIRCWVCSETRDTGSRDCDDDESTYTGRQYLEYTDAIDRYYRGNYFAYCSMPEAYLGISSNASGLISFYWEEP